MAYGIVNIGQSDSSAPEALTVHSGTTEPSSTLGNNGDIYVKLIS